MQSDIHLQMGHTVLIIDAKYYSHTTQMQYDKHTVHSNNMYQIFTYVKNRDYDLAMKITRFPACYCMPKRKKIYSLIMCIRYMEIR